MARLSSDGVGSTNRIPTFILLELIIIGRYNA